MSLFAEDIIKGIEELNEKKKELVEGNKFWTIALKEKLIDIAKIYNLKIFCTLDKDGENEHHDNTEWLYDIIMFTKNNDVFDEVHLVCESEWSNDFFNQVLWDFYKLLFTRSKIRLLVFQVSKKNYKEYKNKLIEIIEKSKSCLKGDLFLFAIWHLDREPDGFIVEKYIKEGVK